MHILLLSACGVKTHVLLLPFCIAMFLFARFKPVWHVGLIRSPLVPIWLPFHPIHTMISNVFKYLYYNIFLSCLFSVFMQQTITTTPLFFSIQLFQGAISLLHIFSLCVSFFHLSQPHSWALRHLFCFVSFTLAIRNEKFSQILLLYNVSLCLCVH